MGKIVLRKNKKVVCDYPSAYALADDTATLNRILPEQKVKQVQQFLRCNAFSFAIVGAKARLGNGYIAETIVR